MANTVGEKGLEIKPEQKRAEEFVAGIRQLLSRETYETRRQAIEALKDRIAVIEEEIATEEFFYRILFS